MVWDWSGVVSWLRGVVWSWLVFWVLGNTFVFNISYVSTIGIYVIGNNLGAAIGKGNGVATGSGIAITVFISRECSLGIIILDSITVFIYSWSIIGRFMIRSWLMVCWSWGMISWSCVNNWLVNNWGYVWGWFVNNWGMVWSWFVDNWGMIRCWCCVIYGGWLVYNWGMVRCWSCVINWSRLVINWGWVIGSSMVDGSMSICWGMDWDMSWGMDSSAVLFSSIGIVYVLGSSMRLTSNNSVVSTMCFVNRVAYSGGIAVFHNLMAGLVSQGNGEKAGDCNKGL